MQLNNEKIFIIGGAGFLGKGLIKRYYNNNDITVYSRDEAKHYFLQKEFPKVRCIIGDVRNLDLLNKSAKNHSIGINAAALKQISAVDENVEEAIEILINGAVNFRKVVEQNNFKAACLISSDKSRAATTLYGSMKFIAGESFIVNSDSSNVRLSTAIYGNVLNSTGSIIPVIWDSIKQSRELVLYSEEMTRFMIDVDEAIDLIELSLDYDGYNIIPHLPSFKIKDLFEIYKERFGLQYTIGKPRVSEKIHEIMIAKEEFPRTFLNKVMFSDPTKKIKEIFCMHYKHINPAYRELPFVKEYSSETETISKEELEYVLESYNFF